jgi:hypothetical protein
MKRDFELFRNIMLELEDQPPGTPVMGLERFPNRNKLEVLEHVQLLLDAGLIEGKVHPGSRGAPELCQIMRITNAGHEFLDNARNDSTWKKVIGEAKSKGVSLGLDLLSKALAETIKATMHIG